MTAETSCAVCTSPGARTQILALMECGSSVHEISAHTGFTLEQVQAHLTHVTLPESDLEQDVGDPMALSDARLQVLLARLGETYISAGLVGDPKTQVAALAGQMRLEQEIARRQEARMARSDAQPLSADVNDWPERERVKFRQYLDWIVARADAQANVQTTGKAGAA